MSKFDEELNRLSDDFPKGTPPVVTSEELKKLEEKAKAGKLEFIGACVMPK